MVLKEKRRKPMRQPINVLVIPYFIIDNDIKYAIFKRSDGDITQWISGGVEGDEEVYEAALRECYEEAGIESNQLMKLDSVASVPGHFFPEYKSWGNDVFVVNEISFAIEVEKINLSLSDEHQHVQWVSYEEALKTLTFESNKVALWELNQRLKR